jgi:hypothetical protein
MDKEMLLKILRNISGDEEADHVHADRALLDFINDEEVREAFNDIPKWYA